MLQQCYNVKHADRNSTKGRAIFKVHNNFHLTRQRRNIRPNVDKHNTNLKMDRYGYFRHQLAIMPIRNNENWFQYVSGPNDSREIFEGEMVYLALFARISVIG